MRGKRWLALVLALLLGAAPRAALAAEQEAPSPAAEKSAADSSASPEGEPEEADNPELVLPEPEPPAGTVTGFPGSGPAAKLTVEADRRGTEAELAAQMPSTLTVLVEGKEASIPVSWYCVGDYAAADDYYYQFSPRWDETRWPLAKGLKVVRDAPYAAVFVTEPGLSTQSAESVELECYNYFVNKMGLNTAAACGILANIYNECSFKPNNLQGFYETKLGFTDESYTEAVDKGTYTNFVNDKAGYGLVQFTWWELKRDLLAYAQSKGKSIGDTQTQLEYLEISLGTKRTNDLLAIPNTAQGAYDAGKYFCDEYEKPGLKDQPGIRARLARDTFWPKYSNALAQAESGVPNALSPPEPVSVSATADGPLFTWNGVAGATKYRVYRDEGEGWVKLANTKEQCWTDSTAQNGKTYTYTVRCLNADGKVVSDKAPEGLSLTFWSAPVLTSLKNKAEGIRLRWNSYDCPGYQVWRREVGGRWQKLDVVSKTSYTDAAAQSGRQYIYTVRCADEAGTAISDYLRNKDKKILCLSAPGVETPKNRERGIRLSWKAVGGAKGYRVYRRTTDGAWKQVAALKGGKTLRWLDKSVKGASGKAFYYTVRAYRDSTLSGYEEPGELTCRLPAPVLKSVSAKQGAVTAKWTRASKSRGYEVQLTRGKTTQSVLVEGADSLRHRFRDLSSGTYQVRVRAWRKVGEKRCFSDWSSVKRVKLKG